MARAFATGNRVGCATWSKPANNDPGVRVFGGVVDGAGGGEFFTPAEPGEIIVTNLSGSAVDVNGESLDGSFMPSPVNLDAFESNAIPVGADDAAPGSVLEFSQPGNGSADTFGWTDLDPDVFPRQAAGAGTPREGVRAVTADDGGNRRALAVFPVPLSTVSNRLGVLNMGKGRAKLTIQYRDRTGKKLGKKKVTLKGKSAQLLDLPSKVAGKDGAYADIKIKGKKAAVWPYTRMEHDSGDVTIVPGIVVG